ncbi:MAG: DUF87 domain-containing protein [Patescibacteria group bacterium]
MAFGKFGAQKMGEPQFNRDDRDKARLSPERQMNKLREQSRSGGSGGGVTGARLPIEPSVLPPTELVGVRERKKEEEREGVTLELTPDSNDKDMEELLGILQAKGFKAALRELDHLDNPHLEDDFHRLLVQYKKAGHPIPGLDPDDPLAKAIDSVLLEVSVPTPPPDKGGSLKEVLTQMEQLYLAMLPHQYFPDPIFFKEYRLRKLIHRQHLTFEIAVGQGGEHAIFYVSVPRSKRDLIEKQIFAVFPRAYVVEKKDDYNPFNQFGATVAAYATYARPHPLPLKVGEEFIYDPLNVTLAAMSKMTKEGEGATIQFVVATAGDYHVRRMAWVMRDLQKGNKSTTAVYLHHGVAFKLPLWRTLMPHVAQEVGKSFEEGEKKKGEKDVDAHAVESVKKKMQSMIYGVNIRIVASARTKARAEAILNEIGEVLGQYDDPKGNRLRLRTITGKRHIREFLRHFIFRTVDRHAHHETLIREVFRDIMKLPHRNHFFSPLIPMNLSELSALFHLAIAGGTTSSRELKTAQAKRLPAVPGLPEKGIVIGKNVYSNIETKIHFTPDDRLRHMYVIGQTGTGKTNFLKNMIMQDIENGEGICFIDPHGVDVLEILSRIPKERWDDVIYFDPAYTDRPMGMNMLEFDPRFPDQKTFVVDEMFKIFKKLYGDVPEAFGPIFEQYFRNATLLVLEDPDTGSTLMDISRVLSDEDFRHLKLSRCRNPIVRHFWEDIAENVRGEGDLRNVVPYITSKFDIFIANEIMRPIVGQQRSAFNFKDVMDNKKILLVNLSKGRLGDVNANLLGLVIVGKIMMTSLARTEYLHQNPPPFYLYIDEFQNVTTNTVAVILSEARKFRLSLTMAHQFIGQLIPEIKNAVFGNVGTLTVFRVGPDDAEYMTKQFDPYFTSQDFVRLDNYHAYLKLLAGGKPIPPFTLETTAFHPGDFTNIDTLKQMSYQRYGRDRNTVEEEIRRKYERMLEP